MELGASRILILTALLVIIVLVTTLAVFLAAPPKLSTNQGTESSQPSIPSSSLSPTNTSNIRLEVAFPNLSFERMVYLTHVGGSTDQRLFLVLQQGEILVFPNRKDVNSTKTFLNITGRVDSTGNEQGLLGLAFDPDFQRNGYLYVYYTAASPSRSVLSRFTLSSRDANQADPNSEKVILEIPRSYPNHNGGDIIFGPDGYLYVGLGDGGGEGDPQKNGQNLGTLLGKILRIDVQNITGSEKYRVPADNPFVNVTGARGEIWAYGLRNPWRFSFDNKTGLLWTADVGQDSYEEIDIIRKGGNYGWSVMEGFHCYPSAANCNKNGLTLPVAEYTHAYGCAVIGGYVYRGNLLKELYGAYIYGDYCSGRIWALRFNGSQVTENIQLLDTQRQLSSFGEGAEKELYILSFDGKIYRLASTNP
ncbi:MAG: PQQ-dependent sugar dehydrogenase [Thaumarchaeota archaeon]|nr:PQQ-dependent sugar dehydrogenase [Nitrososphaerota archaeon]MCL5317024.1 PQQ-dependent sugar dehydrogenase [Nitrososphaerota archaeon]